MAAAPADRTRPTISIVGIAGASTARQVFNVSFADNVGLASDAELATSEVTVIAGTGGAAVTSPTVDHTAGAATAAVSLGRDLVAGGRLVINPGAAADTSGNKSAGISGSAIKAQASPMVTSVLMSNLDHSAQNAWTLLTPSTDATNRDAEATATSAGRTRFAIEVRFNKYIATVDDTELLEDVLARTVGRTSKNDAADTVSELRALLGVENDADAIVGGAPGTKVRYQMTTPSVAYLPMARDLVEITAGTAALNDDPNTTANETSFRPTEAEVATGYAADVNTSTALAKIDQSKNGGSQRRIAVQQQRQALHRPLAARKLLHS